MLGLIGRKIGMTQVFNEKGDIIPVTVIEIQPNLVVSERTEEKNGYSALVLGTRDVKESRITKPYKGQFAEGMSPKETLVEFRNMEKKEVGSELSVELLNGLEFVDVTGVSKGKGFQGVMKRYNFGGGRATHGSKFHREAGGTGNSTTPGRTFKGTKQPGRMGDEQVTVLSLKVVMIDKEKNVILVKGAVPGRRNSTVLVKTAKKK